MPKTADSPPLPMFNGWDTPHFTPIPDQLLDEWLPHLSEAELKVLLYIMRRTFGFKKNADAISLRQMADGIVTHEGRRLDWGAGVTLRSVQRALPALLAKGLIEAHKAFTEEGDAATTVYRLHLRGSSQNDHTPGLGDTTGADNLSARVRTQSLQQETVVQETENKKINTGSLLENDSGPSLPAVLAPYGGAWALCQSQAQLLCTARGWSPAQLAAALVARRERTLRAKLQALAAA